MIEIEHKEMRMLSLTKIRGLESENIKKLTKIGVKTPAQLLKQGLTPKARRVLADILGVQPSVVLRWVICASFFQIEGITPEYVELLDAAGITSPQALSIYSARELEVTLERIIEERGIGVEPPSYEKISKWISHSQKLRSEIWYDGLFCYD
jgi:predicted flap endonuclease-1-like 5' DNA nuclease